MHRYNPTTLQPQLSEQAILGHAQHLSETIGFRTVGSREHALGDAWMLAKAEELKASCEEAVAKEPGRKLQCEVWRQEGSGSHRCVLAPKVGRAVCTFCALSHQTVPCADSTL